MSSEIFENREEDFHSLYDRLKNKVKDRIPMSSGEEKKKLMREVDRGIEGATLLIQEMEEEVKAAPPNYRNAMVTKVRGYNRDVEQLVREAKRNSGTSSSIDPMGMAGVDEFDHMAASQRSRLMQGSESLNRGTQSLARTHRIAAETDQIGEDIIDELGTQRESLVRTKDRLGETDANLSHSRKILKSMARRVMTNKMILAFIIFLEMAILGGVIYWKFFS